MNDIDDFEAHIASLIAGRAEPDRSDLERYLRANPGMTVGDKKTVNVPCDQAYGPLNPEMRQAVPREGIPADIPLDIGTQLQMQTPEGQVMPVTVVDVDEAQVTLDANHPLAGKDLTFNIELVGIDQAA